MQHPIFWCCISRPDPLVEPLVASSGAGSGGPATEVLDGTILWNNQAVVSIDEMSLRGDHNVENVLAAATVALELGLSIEDVAAGLRTFAGVQHRLEEIATVDGVLYVNDSKATNIASAQSALTSFEGEVHAILGGRGKDTDYGQLSAVIKERCVGVYLIGEDAEAIGKAMQSTGIPTHQCGDLGSAFTAARERTRPGDVVLLAPAAASYDQYRSFEERGEHFCKLVNQLASDELSLSGRPSFLGVEDGLNGP